MKVSIGEVFGNIGAALKDIANPEVHIDIRVHHLAMIFVGVVVGFILGAILL